MTTVVVSARGQIALPAGLGRRLGLANGAQLKVQEEADELRLCAAHPITDVSHLAGMYKVPTQDIPRHLEDFNPASIQKNATV
jgi:bifunctional DNA-binding transcriptional regulator/antitoxin component of YhaV-PrlF toxin-antitoxin module